MALKTAPFDPAEFLTDDETITAYLTEALESDDPKLLAKAVKTVIRALRARITDSTTA
jgi:DNA-binding phage protein